MSSAIEQSLGRGAAIAVRAPSAVEVSLAAEAERVLAEKSKSFHLASRFLPEKHRADVALLYTFCRAVDDAADDRVNEVSGHAELDRIQAELDGRADRRPLIAAFVTMAARTGIDLRHAAELIRGVRSDIGRVIVEDDAQLLVYAYRVAATVGLMMSPLMDVTDPRAAAFAIDLGMAMQLTNIARDVAEDARLGRVYLPRARLAAGGVRPEALLAGEAVDRAAVARVVGEILELAERYYRSADQGLHFIPARPRTAILVASRVYRGIGRRLARNGCDALAGRTVVPKIGKLATALVALAQLVRPTLWGFGAELHAQSLHAPIAGLPGASISTNLLGERPSSSSPQVTRVLSLEGAAPRNGPAASHGPRRTSAPSSMNQPGEPFEPVPGLSCVRYGNGPRIIIGLHGWSGSHATFRPLLPHLPADVSLYAFDQPSFGRSAPPADWRMETFIAPIVRAIEVLELRDVTLLGSCGGAVIGLELARALGDRVTRMVMLDPFAYVPWYFGLLTFPVFGRFFYLSTFANPIGRWIADRSLAKRRAESTTLTGGFEGVSHRHAHQYLCLLCTLHELSRYAPIRAEVDLLHGERTFPAVKRSVAMFQSIWPNSRAHEILGAGHLPIEEAPSAVAAIAFDPPQPK